MSRKPSGSSVKAGTASRGAEREPRSTPRSAKPRGPSAGPKGQAASGLDDKRLRAFVGGQREILSLLAAHENLGAVAAGLDTLFHQVLDAAACTFVLVQGQDARDCLVLTPNPGEVHRRSIAVCDQLVGRVAEAVKSWGEPLRIDIGSDDEAWADLRLVLGDRRGRAGWALPIRGQGKECLGLILLHMDAERRPDAGDRQGLGLMEPLTRVAIDSTRRDEAAQVADERFASLAATIPGVVYQRRVTPDGDIRYSYISEGARDLFGVDPEQVLADPQALFESYAPDYRDTFRDRLLAASKALTLWDVEAQIVTPDGKTKWTHAIARPNRREDGSVMWNGVILDATRIKEAEFATSAAEERTRAAIVESITQGIAIFDHADKLVTSNSQLLNLFPGLKGLIAPGIDYGTMLKSEAEGCVEPDGSAPSRQMLRDRLRRHDEPESSVERRLADGRWILINERRSEAGTIVLYTDVTDLKRREEQLQIAKDLAERANMEFEKTVRRLDIALENMAQGLCLFDSKLRLILCNRRYAKMFRLPAEMIGPGMSILDQISHVARQGGTDEADALALVDDRLSYTASRARCTYRLTLPDGRVVEVVHQPLPDGGAVETFTEAAQEASRDGAEAGDGAAEGSSAAEPDFDQQPDDLAARAVALAQARDEARSADRGKAAVLRGLAGGLKASLGAIVESSEAMAGAVYGPLGDKRYRQFAQAIRESGTALMGLVDDLEELSTISAGDLELAEQRLDLGKLLARCVRIAARGIVGKPPSISITTPSDGYQIRADEPKLKQAFLNLLSNAVRFTPSKGRVEVSIIDAEDGGLEIAIADTGPGMAPKTVSNIMARPSVLNGANLGLPVVKSLIERHGGQLMVSSAKGKGTTAMLRIPENRILSRP